LHSQIKENYFTDTEQKEGGKMYAHLKYKNTIIVAGQSFERVKFQPVIIRVDTAGNTVWNTGLLDTSNYNDSDWSVDKLLLGHDQYLYAVCKRQTNEAAELWKINPENGITIWKKAFHLPVRFKPDYLVDFDSSSFIFGYTQNYFQPGERTKFAFIKKKSGDTVSTVDLGTISWDTHRYALCTDNNHDIYYTILDTVYKVKGSNPKQILWKKQYFTKRAGDYNMAYFDSATASVFLIERGYDIIGTQVITCNILKVAASDGALLHSDGPTAFWKEYQDMKVIDGVMYCTWRQLYVPSGEYCVTKYDMNTGTSIWNTCTIFSEVVGQPDNDHVGESQSAMSLDVDRAGNIYLTGYYADSNYGPANWGIMKLNAQNGESVYQKTITEDSLHINHISWGLASCVFNDRPYFLGELETYFELYKEEEKLTFIKMEPISGDILIKKYVGGMHQFASKTIAIADYSPTTTMVLKQTGRSVNLEMYDYQKKLLWVKNFSIHGFLLAGNLTATPSGNIVFTASSRSYADMAPYFGQLIDSLYLYQLTGSGNVIRKYSFKSGAYQNAYPLELYADTSGISFFYQQQTIIYYRKLKGTTLSPELNFQMLHDDIAPHSKYAFNNTFDKILTVGYDQFAKKEKLLLIDKNALTCKTLAIFPAQLTRINHVLELNADTIFLCGKDEQDNESVGLYSTKLNDTIWTKRLANDNHSAALKAVCDEQQKNIYLISHTNNDIFIRKIAASTGVELWEKHYNGTSGKDDVAFDIAYDLKRKQLLVSGYETTATANTNVVILILDTLGNILNTITRTADFPGKNAASCIQLLPDGTQWVGGNLNKNPLGLAGFIYEIGSSIVLQIPIEQSASTQGFIFPNPFSTVATLIPGKNLTNATAIIYNIHGEKIKTFQNLSGEKVTIDRGTLASGIYFIQLIQDQQLLMTNKLIVLDN
jgi:hypothetical protein